MSVRSDIQVALETKLLALATTLGYSVSWPNVVFTPTADPYFAAFNLPVETTILGLAAGSEDDFRGIYQIDVRVKKGSSTQIVRTMVDAVLTDFSKASEQTFNGVKVLIEKAWVSASFDVEDNWYVTPISVRYRTIA